MSIEMSPMDALKMFDEQANADAEPAAPVSNEPAPEANPTPAAEQPREAPQAQAQDQENPEGVATRDGKHVIPYSVLQSERTRAANAERELQDARAQLAALQAAATSKPTANNGAPADTNEEPEADSLALLEEDFPTVAAELKATRAALKALEAKFAPVEESARSAEEQRAAQQAMTVQEAIDTVPKLAHIQAANSEAFDLARKFDETLRARADWANKPMTERFAKVVELVEASLGEISIPGQQQQSADPAALKAAAAAKLANAPKAVPTSLSQFPAGEPVATDEQAAVEQMSTAQLASKMARMSPDQIDAYFANL